MYLQKNRGNPKVLLESNAMKNSKQNKKINSTFVWINSTFAWLQKTTDFQ